VLVPSGKMLTGLAPVRSVSGERRSATASMMSNVGEGMVAIERVGGVPAAVEDE